METLQKVQCMESFHLLWTLITSHHQPPFQKGTINSLGAKINS